MRIEFSEFENWPKTNKQKQGYTIKASSVDSVKYLMTASHELYDFLDGKVGKIIKTNHDGRK